MKKMSFDEWEKEFMALCDKFLEEEPLYPYSHLWRETDGPREAFDKYLEENPDYAEKFEDMVDSSSDQTEKEDFLKLAKQLEQKKIKKVVEEKMSRFCPECAREIGTKKKCKCGYSRGGGKSETVSKIRVGGAKKKTDAADDWLAQHGFSDEDDEFLDDDYSDDFDEFGEDY